MERVRIYPGILKSVVAWLLLVPTLVYIGWKYWRAFYFVPVLVWLIVGVSFLLLFTLAIHYLAMTLHLFPAVVVSAEGIYDSSTPHGARMIPWSSVAKVEACSLLLSRSVGITLKEGSRAFFGKSWRRRFHAILNLKMGYPEICIPASSLSMSAETFLELIKQYRPEALN